MTSEEKNARAFAELAAALREQFEVVLDEPLPDAILQLLDELERLAEDDDSAQD